MFPSIQLKRVSLYPLLKFAIGLATAWPRHGALAMWNSYLRVAFYDQLGRQSFSSSSSAKFRIHREGRP